MAIDHEGVVSEFIEKPPTTTGAINGGFMVFESEAIRRYCPEGEDLMLEAGPLVRLAKDGQLTAYVHHGFWQQMDTPRERELLEEMWKSGQAPWKRW
jgi:glucose-1-phosphate cytidylyltransferase